MRRLGPGIIFAIGVAAIVAAASGTLRQVSWTCPVCHQTLQFDRRDPDYIRKIKALHLASHGSDSTSGSASSSPPSIPVALIEGYRQARSRLDRVTSSQLPEFSRPGSLSDLYYALVKLRSIAEGELNRLAGQESGLNRRLRDMIDEIDSNKNRISELSSEIQVLDGEVSSLESGIHKAESKKAVQTELREKLLQVTAKMEEQSETFRQSFYSRLREAQSRNLIAPPSSYHILPSPIQPKYEQPEQARMNPSFERREPPVFRPIPEARLRSQGPVLQEQTGPPARESSGSEASVRNEIDQIDRLVPQLVSTRREVEALRKRLAQPEQQAGEQRADIDRLGNQKESMEARKASLSDARDKLEGDLADLASDVARLADDLVRKWVTRSFWRSADEHARNLLTGSEAEHSAAWFGTFRKVMTHTVEFGSDVFNVIGKTPEASLKDDWDQLDVELNQAVENYKLNLFLDYTRLPEWLQSLVPKGSKPWRNAER